MVIRGGESGGGRWECWAGALAMVEGLFEEGEGRVGTWGCLFGEELDRPRWEGFRNCSGMLAEAMMGCCLGYDLGAMFGEFRAI